MADLRSAGRAGAGTLPTSKKAILLNLFLPGDLPIEGCVVVDHLKSVDWKERNASFIGRVVPELVTAVLKRIGLLFGF